MGKNVEFRPSDTELITQLLKFVAGKHLSGFIGFTDVYSKEPWELIGESSKKTHYFFTQLKKKKTSDARFNRTTSGSGSWTQQDKGKPILDEDENLIIGYKRSLNYKHKKTPSLNGQWMMKEYFLSDFLLRQLKLNETKDFVICAIKKNPRSVVGGNTTTTTISSDDVLEYERFIARVLQEAESSSSIVTMLEPSEPKDNGMLLQNDSDDLFGMENHQEVDKSSSCSLALNNLAYFGDSRFFPELSLYKNSVDQYESDLTMVVHSLILSTSESCHIGNPETCHASCIRSYLVKFLQSCGYNADLCATKWQGCAKIPGGEHEYIEVISRGNDGCSERYIIDLDFRSHFEIARAVKSYNVVLSCLPPVYVGTVTKLQLYLW